MARGSVILNNVLVKLSIHFVEIIAKLSFTLCTNFGYNIFFFYTYFTKSALPCQPRLHISLLFVQAYTLLDKNSDHLNYRFGKIYISSLKQLHFSLSLTRPPLPGIVKKQPKFPHPDPKNAKKKRSRSLCSFSVMKLF